MSIYRLWRDLGYAVGAITAGITADTFGAPAAVFLVGLITFLSGLVVAVRMREARGRPRRVDMQSATETLSEEF